MFDPEVAIRKLFYVEKLLRELATKIQLERVRVDAERLADEYLYDANAELGDFVDLLEEEIKDCKEYCREVLGVEDCNKVISAVMHAQNAIWYLEHELMTEPGFLEKREIDGAIEDELEALEKYVKEITGRGCRWGIGRSFVAVLNDIASCVHRLAEYMHEHSAAKERVGECLLSKDADSRVRKLCRYWTWYVNCARKCGLYATEDEYEHMGWGMDGYVYLRVGSAPGHRTYVNFREGKLEYYDEDAWVRKAIKRALEDYARLKCEDRPGVVVCTIPEDANIRAMAGVLALATSMDIREGNAAWWEDWLMESGANYRFTGDPEEDEYKLVGLFIKREKPRKKK